MFKFTPVIDGEISLFYYKPNFLEKHEYDILKMWLDNKQFIAQPYFIFNQFWQARTVSYLKFGPRKDV